MTEPSDELPWKVHLTCCGRDAGVESFATQPEAEAFRESYTSGPGVNEHAYSEAHKHLPGHQRSGVISHAEPAEPRDEPRARLAQIAVELRLQAGIYGPHNRGELNERECVEVSRNLLDDLVQRLKRAADELDAVLAAAPPESRQPKHIEDALHAVFTQHGIASRSDYPNRLIGDLISWAAEMCRQSTAVAPDELTDDTIRDLWRQFTGPKAEINGPLIRFAHAIARLAAAPSEGGEASQS